MTTTKREPTIADRIRETNQRREILAARATRLLRPAVAGGRCPRCGAAAYGTRAQRCEHL